MATINTRQSKWWRRGITRLAAYAFLASALLTVACGQGATFNRETAEALAPTGAQPAQAAPAPPAQPDPLVEATETPTPVPTPTGTSTPTPSPSPTNTPPPAVTYPIGRIVAADLFEVVVEGRPEAVRPIGVKAPNALDPQRPVDCYGAEATQVARALLEGKRVRVEGDPAVGARDADGRVLAYIWLPDGGLYNEVLLRQGFAVEDAVAGLSRFQPLFSEAQVDAKRQGKGLWSPRTCGGFRQLPPDKQPQKPAAAPKAEPSPKPGQASAQPKPGGNCDPSYPGVCIPPPPPLLACQQLAFGKFKVIPPDPHRFDPDRNGIGCE